MQQQQEEQQATIKVFNVYVVCAKNWLYTQVSENN